MTAAGSELSHLVRLDRLGAAPVTVGIEADQAARAALAERFDLPAVDALSATLTIRRRAESGWIEVSGSVLADVVQTCVVTTDPVQATINAEVLELFDDSGDVAEDEIMLDPIADTPEPISGETLDVGEIVAQALGLALDPYPRAPGATPAVTSVGPTDADGASPAADSPFAGLAGLKAHPFKKG